MICPQSICCCLARLTGWHASNMAIATRLVRAFVHFGSRAMLRLQQKSRRPKMGRSVAGRRQSNPSWSGHPQITVVSRNLIEPGPKDSQPMPA
jgi:hypothetical protein